MTIGLDGAVDQRATDRQSEFYTCLPVVVARYDADLQQADCQPMIRVRSYNQSDQQVDESRPQIINCPVQFAGDEDIDLSYTIRATSDIGLGTKGVVFFSMESLQDYLTLGVESGPYEFRKHGLSDGIFVPGILTYNKTRQRTPDNGIRMAIRSPLGPLRVELDANTGCGICEAPNQFIVRAGNSIILDAPDVQTTGGFTPGQ